MSLIIPIEELHCAECDSTRFLLRKSGENICLVCGFVNTHKDERSKVEVPNGFIGDVKKDKPHAYSKDFSNETTLLKKWNRTAKVSDSIERNFVDALSEITRLGDELSISIQVLEKASDIYRKLLEKNHLKGHKIDTLCAAAVYISCRQLNYLISLGEIVKASGSDKKDVGKEFRFLIKKLNIKISRGKYIKPIISTKKFSKEDLILINRMLLIAQEKRFTIGKNPNAITASACYLVSQLVGRKITQRKLSEEYHITQTTIRNRYKELLKQLDIVIVL